MIASILIIMQTEGCSASGDGDEIPPIHITEFQSAGNSDEWIELTTSGNDPVNLYDYALTTDGGGRAPSHYFGDYEDLSAFGIPAVIEDRTYHLSADNLYVDTYWAAGSNSFHFYRMKSGNEYGTYYHFSNYSLHTWWDDENQTFLNETEKSSIPEEDLEDHVYQINLPNRYYIRHQYVSLNTDDIHKYHIDQELHDTEPGGSFLDLDLGSLVDGNETTPNNETQAMETFLQEEYGWTLRSATFKDYYLSSDLSGSILKLYDDQDGSFITDIHLTVPFYFATIDSLPNEGTIFVNDNNPDTMLYYSHFTGGQASSPGEGIIEVDLTNESQFDHYTDEEYYMYDSAYFGPHQINFTDPHIASQIVTREIQAPILTDTIYINMNTGAIASGPGTNIVEITLDLQQKNFSWLFPKGATYTDWSMSSTPVRSLDHLVVVTDDVSDPDESRNDLLPDGHLYIWNQSSRNYEGRGIGWGTQGPAPNCPGDWTAQAYFDGDQYFFDTWTLGDESPGQDNSVPAPAYGTVDVVINELNPTFVELYNRGNTACSMAGWRLTSEIDAYTMSGNIGPGEFVVIPETSFMVVPWGPSTGGRVSLFDDLGILVSSIGFQTDVPSDTYSYCARHIDGMGTDYGYNDSMNQPWATGVPRAQRNADWDLGPARTTGSRNYQGTTILQIGIIDGEYRLIENLSEMRPELAEGVIGTPRINDVYLNTWDIVFCLHGLTPFKSAILDDYVTDGGRLYVEYANDWTALSTTDFYQTIDLESEQHETAPIELTGHAPVAKGMEIGYNGSVRNRFIPNDDSYTVLEENGSAYAVLSLDIDVLDPEKSYRVITSSVRWNNMTAAGRGDSPGEYIEAIVDFFMLTDDDLNHRPEVTLSDPIPFPEIPVYKNRPTLTWGVVDMDVWDQVQGEIKYTLYLDLDETKVQNMDPSARSAVYVWETGTSTIVDSIDAPTAGVYYWGIFCQDRYDKVVYTYGGIFRFDDEPPLIVSMVPMNGTIMGDPLQPWENSTVFGPTSQNSKGELIGRPDRFAITLSDNLGLLFNNSIDQAPREIITPPARSFDQYPAPVEITYIYNGSYEDDLPIFYLFLDPAGTNNDIESLDGIDHVTLYMIPDGPIPSGTYEFEIYARDLVLLSSILHFSIEIDFIVPDPPTHITIEPETYRDMFDNLYLREGETYTLTATAPSTSDDPSMDRVVFQQAATNQLGTDWEIIGTDDDTSDGFYSVPWVPDTDNRYIRVVSYDSVGNYDRSEVFDAFHVDGWGPAAPLTLQATLNNDGVPTATISGYIYDTIIEGQTSGMSYVVVWHYDEVSDVMEPVRDEFDEILKVPVIDYLFQTRVDVQSVTEASGDIAHVFYAQGLENVGNPGEMSGMATWTNTGLPESVRVVSPATVRDVPMRTEKTYPVDQFDEIRSITVTFLTTEQDYDHYLLSLRERPLTTISEAEAIGLPSYPYPKFLFGYYNVEVTPGFTHFEALVTIDFHISSRSHLGTTTHDILSRLRCVSRGDDGRWIMHEPNGGGIIPVDEAKGLYRVQVKVMEFSDFALVVALSDLTVPDVVFDTGPHFPGDILQIYVTVRNGGAFPRTVQNVRAKVLFGEEHGSSIYIGELEFGEIDPGFMFYPDPLSDTRGLERMTLNWTVPDYLGDNETLDGHIKVIVDPDGYVRETSEINNEWKGNITLNIPPSPPFLFLTHPQDGDRVEGTVIFGGGIRDNIMIPAVEFRIGNSTWGTIPEFAPSPLFDGYDSWYMEYDSTMLEDGEYTFEFRTYDGKHYSETSSVTIIVDNTKERSDSEDEHFPVFFILLVVLLILFGTLTVVVRTPSRYFMNPHLRVATPPGRGSQTSIFSIARGGTAPGPIPPPSAGEHDPHLCRNCGAPIKIDAMNPPIRYVCPVCGDQRLTSEITAPYQNRNF